ncbi:MAG: hypothetical protein ABSC72_01645 [Methylovirgula sp.]|jgi:hypothetical protein
MSEQLQLRRGTAAQVAAFTGAQGEAIVDTTNNRLVVQDGATAGGFPAAKLSEVVTNTRTQVSDAAYSVQTTDRMVAFIALTAARLVSLPAAASFPTGMRLIVIDESGACSATNTITVTAAGTDLINGLATAGISSAYGFVAIESNGSGKWTIVDQAGATLGNFGAVGIGTAADPTNPLSVTANNVLFNELATGAGGTGDFRIKLNKASSTNTASTQYQDGFTGHAEVGLCGDDNFHFKVSPDGSSWQDALVLNAATGVATFVGATFNGTAQLAAGTATAAPLTFASGTNLTSPAAGAVEYDGTAFYATVAANERGVVSAEQIQVLSSAYTLTSQTAAQKLFNASTSGAITLAAGTYQFECVFSLSSMSATSGSFGFALGGTATFTQAWHSSAVKTTALATAAASSVTQNTAANTAIVAANTSTLGYAVINGIIRVTAAGTIIPQVSLGVAAAAIVGASSYFKISPLGAAALTTVGNWS